MTDTCSKHSDIVQITTETHTLVKTILTNHLPHIEAECRETKRWTCGIFAAVILAVIVCGLKVFGVL